MSTLGGENTTRFDGISQHDTLLESVYSQLSDTTNNPTTKRPLDCVRYAARAGPSSEGYSATNALDFGVPDRLYVAAHGCRAEGYWCVVSHLPPSLSLNLDLTRNLYLNLNVHLHLNPVGQIRKLRPNLTLTLLVYAPSREACKRRRRRGYRE